ncbi:MobA/MobL family protein [Sphingomonas sp. NPDC079357]|uniref:MobA/MobL family protein n=1 Tax=Sphingomonas sp. NPDC079357 TaxID=3364518 RepID=UPI00384C1631
MLTTYTVAPAVPSSKDLALAGLTDPASPLAITPVIHPKDGVPDPKSRTFWTAAANALYIVRRRGMDLFGQTPDLADKLALGNDLVDFGRRGPIGCDSDALGGLALWEAADRAAQVDRPSAPVAFHIIGWLPANGTCERWRDLTLEFLDREVVANGMVADWAVHALADADGRWVKKPHLHALLTHRFWKPGRRTGEPNGAWLGSTKQRQKMADAWAAITGS